MWLEGFFTLPITIITAAMILAYIFEGHPRLDAEAYSYEEREQPNLADMRDGREDYLHLTQKERTNGDFDI